jgi:hypothetical protein
MNQFQIKLGHFYPLCLSSKKSLGRSNGMRLSEFNCDSTLESYWVQVCGFMYRKIQDIDKLAIGLKQNSVKYKVANMLMDCIRIGFEFQINDNAEATMECYKIEGTLLKFRPTKESREATRKRQAGVKTYKYLEKIEVEAQDIILGILCGFIAVKFDFNIDEGELISILTSKQFNKFKL